MTAGGTGFTCVIVPVADAPSTASMGMEVVAVRDLAEALAAIDGWRARRFAAVVTAC